VNPDYAILFAVLKLFLNVMEPDLFAKRR